MSNDTSYLIDLEESVAWSLRDLAAVTGKEFVGRFLGIVVYALVDGDHDESYVKITSLVELYFGDIGRFNVRDDYGALKSDNELNTVVYNSCMYLADGFYRTYSGQGLSWVEELNKRGALAGRDAFTVNATDDYRYIHLRVE